MSLMTNPVDLQASSPAPRRRRKRRSRLGFVLALLGVIVVLPGVALEIYVRDKQPYDLWQLTGREQGANPMRAWAQVDAYSAYRGRSGNAGVGKTINSLGFISTPELTVAKDPDVIRIVFLGGSSTAGTGADLSDEDTWPWVATNELLPSVPEGKRLEFINAALGGYCTFESYGRLWSRLRAYEPDIVVVYHGWNEMYYFDRSDPERFVTWRTLSDGSWTLDRTEGKLAILEPWWIDHLLRHSQLAVRARIRLAALMEGGLDGEVGGRKQLDDDFDHRGLETFRTNMRFIAQACEMMGAELFVGKQATLIAPDLPEEERERCRYDYHGFGHDAHVAAYEGLYRVIDEEFPADRVIDVNRLNGQPEVFEDHVHPTVPGARRIAAIVADAVAPVLSQMD